MRVPRFTAGLAAVLCLVTTLAVHAAPPLPLEQRLSAQQMHATGLDTLSREQLALLDRLLVEEGAQADTPPEREAPPVIAGAPAVAPSPAGLFAGAQDGPVKGRLVGEVAGWAPGTVFTFEDGQQWQVIKGELRLRQALHSPQVVAEPGVMGRWFLQVDEDLPKARVQRIR